MAREQTPAEVFYRFAQQLLTNADNLHIPEELRKSSGAYKLILVSTLVDWLQRELSDAAANRSEWTESSATHAVWLIQERWQQRSSAIELLMRGISASLRGVCTGEFSADYIKANGLNGLKGLGFCKDVETRLSDEEYRLQR